MAEITSFPILRNKAEEPNLARTDSAGASYAREANHRLANNLSMIAGLVRLQKNSVARCGGSFDAAGVAEVLGVVAGRIDAIGFMHRSLADAQAAGRVELDQFIRTICTQLVTSVARPDQVQLTFDLAARCAVSAEQAVPIALIVNEVVTNSLKYAHPTGVPGLLHVSCHGQKGEGVTIEVVDDGIGLPEDFDLDGHGAVGFRIIRTLCSQLNAEFALNQRPIGIQFRLSVPLEAGPSVDI